MIGVPLRWPLAKPLHAFLGIFQNSGFLSEKIAENRPFIKTLRANSLKTQTGNLFEPNREIFELNREFRNQ
jgi:hypothetical protein